MKLSFTLAVVEKMMRRIDVIVRCVIEDQRTVEWLNCRMWAQVYSVDEFKKLPEWAQKGVRYYYWGQRTLIETVFVRKGMWQASGRQFGNDGMYAA